MVVATLPLRVVASTSRSFSSLRSPAPCTAPYAYGLSGFSNVLESFNGGNGVIGIHGNNDPSSIGGDVSSGCIRLHNDVITRMVEEIGVPLGTPVEVVA